MLVSEIVEVWGVPVYLRKTSPVHILYCTGSVAEFINIIKEGPSLWANLDVSN
jgi:hypothetical protein